MRDLIMQDVYKMSKILKKMGLKPQINDGESVEQVGLGILLLVFENLHMAQDEVNDFMGSLVGITGDEFGKLPFDEGSKHLEEFKNKPGIVNFFKSARRLMK